MVSLQATVLVSDRRFGVRGGVRWKAADVMSAVTGACVLLLPDGAEKQPRGSSHSQLATHKVQWPDDHDHTTCTAY